MPASPEKYGDSQASKCGGDPSGPTPPDWRATSWGNSEKWTKMTSRRTKVTGLATTRESPVWNCNGNQRCAENAGRGTTLLTSATTTENRPKPACSIRFPCLARIFNSPWIWNCRRTVNASWRTSEEPSLPSNRRRGKSSPWSVPRATGPTCSLDGSVERITTASSTTPTSRFSTEPCARPTAQAAFSKWSKGSLPWTAACCAHPTALPATATSSAATGHTTLTTWRKPSSTPAIRTSMKS